MNSLTLLSSVIFTICIGGIGCAFLVYPLLLGFTRLLRGRCPIVKGTLPWSVSLITIVRGSAESARRKVENGMSVERPSPDFEFILFWDGADNVESLRSTLPAAPGLKIMASSSHEGKNAAINQAVERSSGQILVFSDADALLDREALCRLLQPLADPMVGGVCGQLVVLKDAGVLSRPQHTYWQFDRLLKTLESDIGSITSNTGVLYAIRRDLFRPLPLAVTDDLFSCLNIVRQHKRFIFEPAARAFITASSKTPGHELQRRRRIVCRSLRGIWMSREVLNPFRYGLFSIGLFLNKVLRRFLPVLFMLILLSTAAMAVRSSPMRWLLLMQFLFYASVVPLRNLAERLPLGRLLRRLVFLAFYFCTGMVGTWLGLIDFLSGKHIAKWETADSADSEKSRDR
jgi:glycosyltransferase involved in cell wall biosynthesis